MDATQQDERFMREIVRPEIALVTRTIVQELNEEPRDLAALVQLITDAWRSAEVPRGSESGYATERHQLKTDSVLRDRTLLAEFVGNIIPNIKDEVKRREFLDILVRKSREDRFAAPEKRNEG